MVTFGHFFPKKNKIMCMSLLPPSYRKIAKIHHQKQTWLGSCNGMQNLLNNYLKFEGGKNIL